MHKSSTVHGFSSRIKPIGIMRSPTNPHHKRRKPRELCLNVTSGILESHKPMALSAIVKFAAAQLEEQMAPKHNKTQSLFCSMENLPQYSQFKHQDQLMSKLGLLSPSRKAPRYNDFSEALDRNRLCTIRNDLEAELNVLCPTYVLKRNIEAVKALKAFAIGADEDIATLLEVVIKELDDGIAELQAIERNLAKISKENFRLSKQLQANQESASNGKHFDTLYIENLNLKAELKELGAKLRVPRIKLKVVLPSTEM